MKQTAVEWLELSNIELQDHKIVFEQAKEMEKEQINKPTFLVNKEQCKSETLKK